MLANGITLAYGTAKGTYTKLAGLKEVPEFGIEPEKVENTTLEDKVKSMNSVLATQGNWSTNSLIRTTEKPHLIAYCVKRRTTRRNSSLNKLTQTTLKFILKVKYLLSLVVAVSMPLSSSPLKLLCSQSWNL